MAHAPHESLARFLGLFVGLVDVDADHEGELVRAGFPAVLSGVVTVAAEQLFGPADLGQESGVGVVVLGRPLHGLRTAGPRHPNWRMGLLHRHHPRVHRPVVVVLALPAEGAGRGPGLDYQVVAFFEPLPVVHRVGVVGPGLHADAPDETGNYPAAGDYVQHGDLFGKPWRVVRGGQHVAQHQYLDLGGQAGQDAPGDIHLNVHT